MSSSSLSSPTPSLANNLETRTQQSHDLEAQLDDQILHIRREIAKLRAQKQRLSSSLLGSSRVQKQLFTRKAGKYNATPAEIEAENVLDGKLNELESRVDAQKDINDIKIHRLAFGVTSFPFSDDAPERRGSDGQNQTMLGLRFDLHPTRAELVFAQRGGKNNDKQRDDEDSDQEETAYFILLRKITNNGRLYLKVHQHTIPAHISVDAMEQKYLPLPDVLYFSDDRHYQDGDTASFHDDSGIDLTQDIVQSDPNGVSAPVLPQTGSVENTGQDLHAFTRTVHAHLRAWHYRVQSAYLVRREVEARPELGVKDIRCENDGRQVTVVWKSDEVALVKIGFDGIIETVVAYGSADRDGGLDEDVEENGESVRLFSVERKLGRDETGEKVRISNLVERLKTVQKYLDL